MQPLSVSDKFHDMELRAANAAPCEVAFIDRLRDGDSRQYGVIIFWEQDGQVWATFGDLTVNVDARQMMRLLRLCRR